MPKADGTGFQSCLVLKRVPSWEVGNSGSHSWLDSHYFVNLSNWILSPRANTWRTERTAWEYSLKQSPFSLGKCHCNSCYPALRDTLSFFHSQTSFSSLPIDFGAHDSLVANSFFFFFKPKSSIVHFCFLQPRILTNMTISKTPSSFEILWSPKASWVISDIQTPTLYGVGSIAFLTQRGCWNSGVMTKRKIP